MTIKFIEKVTSNHNGPAWIGRVTTSKSGRTIFFNGKAFKRAHAGSPGNYYDADNGDPYWISGIKRDGHDRHWAGSGQIEIEGAAVDEYLEIVGAQKLDCTRFRVVQTVPTDRESFHERENLPRK